MVEQTSYGQGKGTVCMSICQSVCLYVSLPVCLSVSLFVFLSVCLSALISAISHQQVNMQWTGFICMLMWTVRWRMRPVS